MIFPCSDFRHVVMTPTILLMCEYLMRCPILSERDIAIGSFLCSMILSVCLSCPFHFPLFIMKNLIQSVLKLWLEHSLLQYVFLFCYWFSTCNWWGRGAKHQKLQMLFSFRTSYDIHCIYLNDFFVQQYHFLVCCSGRIANICDKFDKQRQDRSELVEVCIGMIVSFGE